MANATEQAQKEMHSQTTRHKICQNCRWDVQMRAIVVAGVGAHVIFYSLI